MMNACACGREDLFCRGMCRPCYYRDWNERNPRKAISRDPDAEFVCRTCKQPKLGKDFYKGRTICIECDKARQKARWHSVQKHARREKRYGISPARFTAMRKRQRNRCAICGHKAKDRNARGAELHVDHNHKTGQVRGLLCGPCNTGLGMFLDDPVILASAICYVEKYK